MSQLRVTTDKFIHGAKFCAEAADILEDLTGHLIFGPQLGGRTGFYLCVGDIYSRVPYLVSQIGTCIEVKRPKYFAFSQEKVRRLRRHPDHRTSRQSRNEDRNQYAGAVRGRYYFVGVSGLPEDYDEVVALVALVRRHDIPPGEALSLATIAKNPHLDALTWLLAPH